MTAAARPRSQREPVRLLDADRDLLAAVPAQDAAAARASTLAPVIVAERGAWRPPPAPTTVPFVGLLVLDGLVSHHVSIGGAGCVELLGPGDVMPARGDLTPSSTLPVDVLFEIEERTEIAVLDGSFVRSCARWPGLMSEVVARSVRRSQSLALQLAIVHLTGTDARLHALLWHLADRWGRVEPDGVVLSLRLSHERLTRLVRGRRPAISQGLKQLAERGLVVRRADGTWLLRGDPPRVRA
jgi:CRP/FNR family transcriptional regulator, cyclic AMP receptor protein